MRRAKKKYQIGVIGSAGKDDYKNGKGASKKLMAEAEKIGRLLAKKNAVVVTGGKDGIMEASSRGAKIEGGLTVGVIKGRWRFKSNQFVDVEVISGMEVDGFDELLLVNMCDGLIALGGGAGTLEEIAIAYRNNKPVVAVKNQKGWAQDLAEKFLDERRRIKIESAESGEKAVEKILSMIKDKNG
ncbi:MAG: TIGR00725 family protein [Candidatus Moranbacteria bacterium]|nr:TIGR00725 family protein [Candidatus Moranbacteria bacterium]